MFFHYYLQMTVVNCLGKVLSHCLKRYKKGQWDLWLCLECDKIISDLDHFLHQYTETQAKLRLRYDEAHSQYQVSCDSVM